MCTFRYHSATKKDIYKHIQYKHRISLVKDCLLGRELDGWGQGWERKLFSLYIFCTFESMYIYYLLKINSFLGKRYQELTNNFLLASLNTLTHNQNSLCTHTFLPHVHLNSKHIAKCSPSQPHSLGMHTKAIVHLLYSQISPRMYPTIMQSRVVVYIYMSMCMYVYIYMFLFIYMHMCP